MVLMLLAVVWIAVLAPPLLKRGAESRRADSIGDFHRQLGVLRRTGPRAAGLAGYRAPARPGVAGATYASQRTAVPVARSRTLKRRRDVLVGLVGSTVVFAGIGMVPRLHVVLAAAAITAVLLVAYVAMLVRIRNLAAEREMKLTFLPGGPALEGPPLLRRSAN